MCIIDVFIYKKSSLLPGIVHTNLIYSKDDQGRVYKCCKFHDPRGRGSRAWPYKKYCENVLFLLKKFSTLRHTSEKTKFEVMMTEEGTNQIDNFMTPGVGALV